MPGMTTGLNSTDPTVVAAFRQALLHQGIAALLIFGTLGLLWFTVRELRPASAAQVGAGVPEPPARRLLRIGFGLLWVFDGVLQAQPGMAVGLPSQVIRPAAQSSPSWVQHLVNFAGTSWSYHPIQAAAGAVWIQVGIGVWLVLARSGQLSRLAGLVSVGWGLVVWVFGESFGGILAPGLSWLTGAPGAALVYCVAGMLVAMPDRYWRTARTGQVILRVFGLFLVVMAVLQAWPGRGFWQGDVHGQPGSLTAMVASMASLSQPGGLASLASGFASLTRAHGFAINLTAVVVLGGLGAVLGSGWRRAAGPAVIALAVFAVAVWVLVQDLGFLGGLGTDPNSMIPMLVLAVAGYQALTRPAEASPSAGTVTTESPPAPGWAERLRPAALVTALSTTRLSSLASAGAVGLVLLGAVPMAAAQASSTATPILAQAVDGSSEPLTGPAPAFTLTGQSGKTVSTASLRGKVVLLTFLDPVCVTDCPLIAQEFRLAGQMLAARRGQVELVAVNLNPLYTDVSYVRAFDREERLTGIKNWLFLTGSPAQLKPIWRRYGVVSDTLPAGAMLGHSDATFVIGADGRLRQELGFNPGPGTQATVSSFATELADAAREALGQS